MRNRFTLLLAVLLLFVAIVLPVSETFAAVKNAGGNCFIGPTGKSVSYGGSTSSADDEDEIQVTVILYEKRSGKWYEIGRLSRTDYDTDYVSVSTTVTVTGGHYYKVTSTHYTRTGTTESNSSGSTGEYWIPA